MRLADFGTRSFGAYFVMSIPASMFATRFGYRKGVLLGLALYCIGALGFWPSAHYEKYAGFVASAFVIASGLATLETMANSCVSFPLLSVASSFDH